MVFKNSSKEWERCELSSRGVSVIRSGLKIRTLLVFLRGFQKCGGFIFGRNYCECIWNRSFTPLTKIFRRLVHCRQNKFLIHRGINLFVRRAFPKRMQSCVRCAAAAFTYCGLLKFGDNSWYLLKNQSKSITHATN